MTNQYTRHNMSLLLWICIAAFTTFSACGLLGGEDTARLFKVAPISAVEVALEIQAGKGDRITIARDDAIISSFHMNRSDTVIYDSDLAPTTSYIWKVTTGRESVSKQATTLDTTSSNFNWQTFSFGEHSSSVLYGVSIIDENNIWAVGEIHMNDSTGQSDPKIYNAVHWDGNEWTLKRITVDFRGNDITTPLEGVHAFSESDIWMAGSLPIYGDGNNWTIFDVRSTVDQSLSLWEIWGSDVNNIYAAGKSGSLAYYNGDSWQKIETSTELDFYDIHGNEEQGVVAVAGKQSQSSDKLILRMKDNLQTESLPTEPIPFSISGIWFAPSGVTYAAGSRLSIKLDLDSAIPWRVLDKEHIGHPYLFAIDANGLNDIVTTGGFGEILHFNGAEWWLYNPGITGNLYDIALKENIAVAVGFDGRQAFIIVGKRE